MVALKCVFVEVAQSDSRMRGTEFKVHAGHLVVG